jgi:hypothetical protein
MVHTSYKLPWALDAHLVGLTAAACMDNAPRRTHGSTVELRSHHPALRHSQDPLCRPQLKAFNLTVICGMLALQQPTWDMDVCTMEAWILIATGSKHV